MSAWHGRALRVPLNIYERSCGPGYCIHAMTSSAPTAEVDEDLRGHPRRGAGGMGIAQGIGRHNKEERGKHTQMRTASVNHNDGRRAYDGLVSVCD